MHCEGEGVRQVYVVRLSRPRMTVEPMIAGKAQAP